MKNALFWANRNRIDRIWCIIVTWWYDKWMKFVTYIMVMFCKSYCGKDVNNLVLSDMSFYTFCHSWQKQMKWTNIILILPTVERLCCLSLESKHKFFDRQPDSSSINANEVNPWRVIIIMPFNQPWSITLVVLMRLGGEYFVLY